MALGIFGASVLFILAFPVAVTNGATVWGWISAVWGLVFGVAYLFGALIRIRQGPDGQMEEAKPSVWGVFGTVATAAVVSGPSLIVDPGAPDSWFSAGLWLWLGFSYFVDKDTTTDTKPSVPGWKLMANLAAACCFGMAFLVKAHASSDDPQWGKALLALAVASGLVLHALLQWRYPLRPRWPGARRPTLCALFAAGSVVFAVVFVLSKLPELSAAEWGKAGLFLWLGTSGAIAIGGEFESSGRHAKAA